MYDKYGYKIFTHLGEFLLSLCCKRVINEDSGSGLMSAYGWKDAGEKAGDHCGYPGDVPIEDESN